MLKRLSPFFVASSFVLSATLIACVIDDSPPRRLGPNDSTSPSPGGTVTATPDPSASATVNPPSSPAPMLVVVDTDQVLQADPGQGVGIFTEYGAGGKWHIWWTCDTAVSNLQCDVVLTASAASGNISNVDPGQNDPNSITTPTPSSVEAHVTTTTQVSGITFSTAPGTIITLQATVGGLSEGPGANKSFFFFVQDGKINGGYTGTLTNPLQLQGKTP